MSRYLTTYSEWAAVTKKIYLERMKGWPDGEMRRYFLRGLSPLEARERAVSRRVRATTQQGDCNGLDAD